MKILSRLKPVPRYYTFDSGKQYCELCFNSKKYPFLKEALEKEGYTDRLDKESHFGCDTSIDDVEFEYDVTGLGLESASLNFTDFLIDGKSFKKLLKPADYKKILLEAEPLEWEMDDPETLGFVGTVILE